jgi:hypothetical protein
MACAQITAPSNPISIVFFMALPPSLVLRDGYYLGDLVQLCLIDYQAQKEIGKKWQCNP